MAAVIAPLTPPTGPETPVWKKPAVRHLLIVALLAEIGYAVLNVSTMPVYLAADPGPAGRWIPEGRGLGASVIGFVVVAYLFSEAVFKSPMGTLADRIGHRRLMLIGPGITTFTAILTMLVPFHAGVLEVGLLILLRVADGLGAAMLWPAAFALMSNSVEDSERQQAMSYLNLCYMLGIALALPIGGAVNDLTGHKYSSLFLASALFAAVAAAVYRLIPHHVRPAPSASGEEAHESLGFGEFIRSVKKIPTFLLLAFVTFAGVGFPMVIIKLFAQEEFGMSESGFGGLVMPAVLAMALLAVPLSKWGESVGKAKAVHWGMAMSSAGLVFISLGAFVPFLRSSWALALGGLPLGIGFLVAIPAWMAGVSDIDPLRRGSNIGAVMTAQGLGAMIGAPVGSALYEKLRGYGVHLAHYSPFIGCAACVTFGWLLSLRLLHDKR